MTGEDLIQGLQAMNFERGQVFLWAGSCKIEGAADDTLQAMNDYLSGVIQSRTDQGDDERPEQSTKELADHVEYELKRFTGVVQEQLGISN